MKQESGSVLIAPILLILIAIIVALFFFFYSSMSKTALIPSPTPLAASTQTLLKEEYSNPFEQQSEYKNPFEETNANSGYTNPFDSLE